MNETSTIDPQLQRVAGALALAGVALAPGREAAIAAQLSATLAACAALRDALCFTDDLESVHALRSTDADTATNITTGTAAGFDVSSGSGT